MARFLHTRVRVSNLNQAIDWYCNHLGFKVISRTDKSPSGNQVAHLELPGNEHTFELTYSAEYKLVVPEDLMHIAIAVPDLIAFCDELEKKGLEIWPGDWRESFPNGRKMAFIDDPDGYEIELLED
ncbi:MAG: VOC family protein [Candidatus Latescibacterota bacterium]